MTLAALRASCAVASFVLLSACDLATDPPPELPALDVSIDFCSNDIPIWIAYQHLGENWVRLTPDANGTVAFTAEYRVAIAFVHQIGNDTRTEMLFTTNLVLAELSGRTCREESGSKTLNGSVAGISGTQKALVSMSFSSVYREPAQTTFTLANLATRPLDIIASRMEIVGTQEQHARRTIIRRSQDLVTGATVPVLDFNASEAITPTTANAAITGIEASDAAFLANNFFSQLETSHLLTYLGGVGNGNHTVDAIPTSSIASGDYHDLFVVAVSEANGVRGAERFFVAPGSHALVLGPALSVPQVSVITSSPVLLLRAQVLGQLQYPSALRLEYDQQLQFSANTWIINVTSSYFGATPFLWDIPMPEMTGAPGWQNSWALQSGDFTWSITGYGVRSELLYGAPPNDGELSVFAVRQSAPIVQPKRFSIPPRSPLFRPRY